MGLFKEIASVVFLLFNMISNIYYTKQDLTPFSLNKMLNFLHQHVYLGFFLWGLGIFFPPVEWLLPSFYLRQCSS